MANIDTSAWKEFALEELFTSVNGDTDIQKKHINGKGEYVITSGLQNNGIAGKSDVEARVLPAKTLTVDMFGNVFYREHEYKMVTHARVFSIIPKTKFENNNIGLFFASCLSSLYKLFSYDNMCSWEKIKSNKILLPVKEIDEIDYKYMEERVQELEEERVQELDKYLKSIGLDNCNLNDDEKEILKTRKDKKEFKLIDILKWQSQKEIDPLKIKLLSTESDVKYPFYGQATINNGIIDNLSLKDEVLNNKESKPTILIHSNNQNIVYLETPFYLKDGHGATSVLQADYLDESIALYLMTCIHRVISNKFTYQNKATKIALKNTVIELPINDNEEIDFDYMKNYIKAIEKVTVAKLDKYNELV